MGNWHDIFFTIVDACSKDCQGLRNLVKLRVSQLPRYIEIRKIGVNHLHCRDVVHLDAVLICEIIHILRKNRCVCAKGTDSKEIISLESGTGNEVLNDGRWEETLDRADNTDFFCFINRIFIVNFLRNT